VIKLVLLILAVPLALLSGDLPDIRKEYYVAVNDEKAAEKFYAKLKNAKSADPVIMAYYGSAQAIRARHANNPYNKLAYLRSGMKTLNEAVAKSPENLEIRYLRFSLQHYVPSFLGYSKHLDADRKKIIELTKQRKFGSMDKPLLVGLLQFMKETKRCSPQEIATLDQAINNG
jgi:hypothetical protein